MTTATVTVRHLERILDTTWSADVDLELDGFRIQVNGVRLRDGDVLTMPEARDRYRGPLICVRIPRPLQRLVVAAILDAQSGGLGVSRSSERRAVHDPQTGFRTRAAPFSESVSGR